MPERRRVIPEACRGATPAASGRSIPNRSPQTRKKYLRSQPERLHCLCTSVDTMQRCIPLAESRHLLKTPFPDIDAPGGRLMFSSIARPPRNDRIERDEADEVEVMVKISPSTNWSERSANPTERSSETSGPSDSG